MKATPLTLRRTRARAGFTLIELLVVITVIAMLFALVVGGFTYADRYSKTSSTEKTLAAIKLGLENYKADFGEYPEPANPGDTISLADKVYDVSGAGMLYQALSGDGFDQIKLKEAIKGKAESDGTIDDLEVGNVKFTDMPKEIWTHQGSQYYMVDGFGKPYQYVKAVPIDPTAATGGNAKAETVNVLGYDLWSYGTDDQNIMARSIETTTSDVVKDASVKWIKNW